MNTQKVQKNQCGKISNIICHYNLHLFYKILVDWDRPVVGW